jgi:hypothetical protein
MILKKGIIGKVHGFHYICVFFQFNTTLIKFFPNSAATTILTSSLVEASTEARNPYLKCECFRILSSLYLVHLPSGDIAADDNILNKGLDVLKIAAVPLSSSLAETLKDEEFQKSKRVRDILKTAERLVKFANIHGDKDVWSALTDFQEVAVSLAGNTDSTAVQKICKNIEDDINEGSKLYAEKLAKETETSEAVKRSGGKKSKKKSNRKSKKKRK